MIGAVGFTLASLVLRDRADASAMLIAARVVQGVAAAMLTPGQPGHPPGVVRPARPRPGDRRVVRAGRRGDGHRAVPRRLARRRRLVAVDLPAQRAARHRRRSRSPSRHVPESRDPDATGRVDWLGAALGALGLAGLTLGPQRAALAGGGRRRRRARRVRASPSGAPRHPLVPLAIFRSRTFSGTNVVTLLLYGALGVVFFLLGLVLQGPLGYTPLQAGAATMPVTLAMLGLSARAGALAERIGPRIPMTVGPLLVADVDAHAHRHHRRQQRTSPGPARHRRVRARPLAHRRPAHGHRARRRRRPPRRHRLRRQQRRRPDRPGARRGRDPGVAGFAPGAAVAGTELLDGFDRVMRFAAATVVGAAVDRLASRCADRSRPPSPSRRRRGTAPPAGPRPSSSDAAVGRRLTPG